MHLPKSYAPLQISDGYGTCVHHRESKPEWLFFFTIGFHRVDSMTTSNQRCARKYVWCCKIYICVAFSKKNPILFSYLSQLLKNSHILEFLPFSFYANKRVFNGSKILHGVHLDDFHMCYLGVTFTWNALWC